MTELISKIKKVKTAQNVITGVYITLSVLEVPLIVWNIIAHEWSDLLSKTLIVSLFVLIIVLSRMIARSSDCLIAALEQMEVDKSVVDICFDQNENLVKSLQLAQMELVPYVHGKLSPEDEEAIKGIISRLEEAVAESKRRDQELLRIIKKGLEEAVAESKRRDQELLRIIKKE